MGENANNTGVSAWEDKTGTYTWSQSTGSQQPAYGSSDSDGGAESARDENRALRARVAELEAQRAQLDCRYAGKHAETSGSHCPVDRPCRRCEYEREIDRLRARVEELEGVLAEVGWAERKQALRRAKHRGGEDG